LYLNNIKWNTIEFIGIDNSGIDNCIKWMPMRMT
jgi:hypothetical protein